LDCLLKIVKNHVFTPSKEFHLHVNNAGMDPAWSGMGRGVLCQLWCRVVSVMCAVRPSTYCIWIVVHSSLIIVLLLKLLYLILSLLFFALSWKITPLWPGLGGCTPPPPSKSIPDNSTCLFGLKKLYYYNHLPIYHVIV
jgi:hypothetical protein